MINLINLLGFSFPSLEIFSWQSLFLIAIGFIWLFVASIQDIKHREVENWWSFSLIIFGLAFRAFLSIETFNYWYFVWGLIGLAVGFIIANIFYYARMFAGGYAKLLMALGVILPLSLSWKTNLELLLLFLVFIMVAGSLYGLIYSILLSIINFKRFKKEFNKQFKKYRIISFALQGFGLLAFIFLTYLNLNVLSALAIVIFFAPLLLIYAKAVEEACMVKLVSKEDLTVGDWLAETLKIGKTTIKPYWEGLSEKELRLINNKFRGKVLIKNGIPFVPVFLLAFVILFVVLYYTLI